MLRIENNTRLFRDCTKADQEYSNPRWGCQIWG